MIDRVVELALKPAKYGLRVANQGLMRVLARRQEPIVLMHGFMGFARMGPLEYFVGVKEALELEGFRVHTPTVDPLNTSEYRAYEWFYGRPPDAEQAEDAERIFQGRSHTYRLLDHRFRPHLAQIYLETRQPVHLIAHSQAAVDVRYLASPLGMGSWLPFADPKYPDDLRSVTVADCIASVTTVGGPHNGVLMADDTELVNRFVETVLIPGVDKFISLFSHDRSDLYRSAREFGRDYMMHDFNQALPDHDDIPYHSIAGVTNEYQVTFFLRPFYNFTRYNPKFEQEDNDGFVPISSAKWPVRHVDDLPVGERPRFRDYVIERPHQHETHGQWTFLGLVYADHVNQIGLPFVYPRNHVFHHLRMYQGLAKFLAGELPSNELLQPNGTWGTSDSDPKEQP